ncbi:MAG TPA: hypothetical protein V6D18_15875 [Thermosynechococcaceae cyanobacterium]
MKLNSTVVLTFALLTLMAGAGVVSASWGMVVGREALKGITQPDTRPGNNLANRKGSAPRREEAVILKEETIIANVKARMGETGAAKPSPAPAPSPKPVAAKASFPMTSKSQGVVLEVSSVGKQGDSMVLKVSLRNTGSQSVRFLYSFLNVEDEQGRSLSARTDGLPAELPASGEAFAGSISVPAAPLEKVTSLSLSLTDYPEQKVQLEVPTIPLPAR